MSSKGIRAVEDALDRAAPAPRVGKAGGARPGERDEQHKLPMLPAGCPVTPLGKLKQVCFYLDADGQLIDLGPRDHGKQHIQNMFGRKAHLVHDYWPRFGKPGPDGSPTVTGWRPEDAAELLMSCCAAEGLFDPQGKVRDRGAWPDGEGGLVLHCGDKIYRTGQEEGRRWCDPGKIDGMVYPTAPAMPRPDPGPVTEGVGIQLLQLLRAWYWERGKIDPYLLLGFIVGASFGGALDWRPHVWVTGDSATGKSTLERKLLQWIFEGTSLRTHSATEAAIRQVLGQKTLPVFFDEIEASEDNDKAKKVIELARLASSEGVIFKGGSDHKATEFIARSCFYFSSILLPPMLAQDRNRMAILELKPVPEGAVEPMLEKARIVEMGRQLRRRVIDQWHRFDATLRAYKTALGRHGHKGRSADQFGTLLAFADLALYDGMADEETVEDWAETLSADRLAEIAENQSDSEEACAFLTGCLLQPRGGDEVEPVSRFLQRACGAQGTGDEIDRVHKARTILENIGLRIVTPGEGKNGKPPTSAGEPKPGDPLFLAIAASHQGLEKLFREKRWKLGVWSQTFGRVPGALRRVTVKFAGTPRKATLVPIDALIEREDGK